MTARLGMATLIARLRSMTDADEDEFTLAGEVYWTDEHLQAELDKERQDVFQEAIAPVPSYATDNAVQYQDYYWTLPNVEEADSGATGWLLQDGNSNTVDSADYTVNYQARHIRFVATTDGSAYYLTYRAFDLNRAAAEVWTQKAANVASRFDVKTDNHQLSRSQLRTSFLNMAKEFRRKAGGRSKTMIREDMSG